MSTLSVRSRARSLLSLNLCRQVEQTIAQLSRYPIHEPPSVHVSSAYREARPDHSFNTSDVFFGRVMYEDAHYAFQNVRPRPDRFAIHIRASWESRPSLRCFVRLEPQQSVLTRAQSSSRRRRRVTTRAPCLLRATPSRTSPRCLRRTSTPGCATWPTCLRCGAVPLHASDGR